MQQDEHVQVKSIVLVTEILVAFCTNLNKVHLLQMPDLDLIESIDIDDDIMVMGKGSVKQNNDEVVQLIIGYCYR
jgi:hypothetical protein